MFGLGDNTQQSNDDPAMLDNVKQLAASPADQVEPSAQNDAPAATPSTATQSDQTQDSPFIATPAPQDDPVADQVEGSAPAVTNEHKVEPAEGFSSSSLPPQDEPADSPINKPDEAEENQSTPAVNPPEIIGHDAVQSQPATDYTPAQAVEFAPADPQHLAGLKQQALEHLEPLSDHVDGTPEEIFKTTMMMIQANDNHTLLEKALEAAKNIEDDKVRAKAMLDVINEINYFSQNNSDNES